MSGIDSSILPGTDIRVSSLGLGCARIGGVFAGQSRVEDLKLLRQAFDAGVRLFDTADIYGQGESERLLGEAFGGCRKDVVIVSKAGYQLPRRKSAVQRLKPILRPVAHRLGFAGRRLPTGLSAGLAGQRFDPESIVAAADASLRRLKTEYLDILLLHSPPPEVIADGSFAEAATVLRQSGRIRTLGVSCERPEDALLALAQDSVSCVEINFSLLHPEAIAAALPAAMRGRKGVIGRQCFASGLLTWALSDPRLAAQPSERIADLRRCHAVANELGRPLGELALAFSLATEGVSPTLLGAHTQRQLEENLGWSRAVLGEDEYRQLYGANSSQHR